MLNRLSSTLLARLVALAMTLTVAFHAAQPVAQPLIRTSGSAFSAATADVAVAPARRDAARQVTAAPLPAIIPVSLAPAPVAGPAGLHGANHVLPPATGPPAWPELAHGPAPRAPPQS